MTDPVGEPGATPEPFSAQPEIPEAEVEAALETEPVSHRRRRRWPGWWSFGVAIAMVITSIVAIVIASTGEAIIALTLTVSAQGLSAIAIVLGLVSVIGRFGRPWGIAGLAIGVVVNPVILLYVISSLGWY